MRRFLTAAVLLVVGCSAIVLPGQVVGAGEGVPAPCADAPIPDGTFISSNVKLRCHFPEPGVIGARFKRYANGKTYMFVTSVAGLSVYNVTHPRSPVLVTKMPLPHFENEDVDLGGNILMISNDAAESRGLLYLIDISDPKNPEAVYQPPVPPNYPLDMGGIAGLGGPGHTASCVNNCDFAWITDGGGLRVYDLRAAKASDGAPELMGTMNSPVGGVAMHDVQRDGNGLYWVAGYDGTAAYRVPRSSNYDNVKDAVLVARTNAQGESTYEEDLGLGDGNGPNDYIHHNSRRMRNKGVVYITEEDYTRPGCKGAGSFQTWKLPLKRDGRPDPGRRMSFLDQWQTEILEESPTGYAPAGVCSAHYFDVSRNLVAQGWYEQGTRFLDVSNARRIRQVGYFVPPRTMTWASYFPPTDRTRQTVYTLDALRGIDVLVIKRDADKTRTAPVRRSWFQKPNAQSTKSFRFQNGYFGWACRLRGAGAVIP
jgi:hypothetical protein